MKKRISIFIISLCLLLTACGQEPAQSTNAEQPKPLDVNLQGPEALQKNESGIYKAEITYGDEKVKNDDVEMIEFEIEKKDGEGKGKMLKPKQVEEGVYEIQTSFSEPGTYTVQSHVSAKGTHNMPLITVTVK
ncbi:FixH family protein [Priestia aryabhattai]|uniref:FixH family protein n=1 Tax=Priestia TaxID=2800373 RepID=UPI0008DC6C54|nr:FixH family protein [Priestia aryabhattai]MBX9967327.1 FixH family protein [Priestia aryabhattai]MBZ6487186.1 FixH family protein [Priestia aryabhattai]MDH3127059.1 FixH family protein [Priestia aryabhattai]MDH3132699.1 FixH family protein [Priestia aryabhattai]MED4153538.1 FixH family protein [Priestia aryabhattai]